MAFLKGNTYIDGDLIVDGDIAVGSLSSKDVAFTQLINPEDNYIAVTTSAGHLPLLEKLPTLAPVLQNIS